MRASETRRRVRARVSAREKEKETRGWSALKSPEQQRPAWYVAAVYSVVCLSGTAGLRVWFLIDTGCFFSDWMCVCVCCKVGWSTQDIRRCWGTDVCVSPCS